MNGPEDATGELRALQRDYTQFGEENPFFWTIGNANPDLDVYFETGVRDVDEILTKFSALGSKPTGPRALDFGCGLGRTSRALASHFGEVHGLDISPSMIARAQSLNKDFAACRFAVHCHQRLGLFASDTFDFIIAINIFPYILPSLARDYVREFLRILKPGGHLYFQATDAAFPRIFFPDFLLKLFRKWRRRNNPQKSRTDRSRLGEGALRPIIRDAGGNILQVESARVPTFWIQNGYFVKKG